MKKTILYIAATTIGFGLMLTNCSKKADPAPAGTTSSTGTATSGTTTTGTTTSGTTTSGSTTSGTTSGSTTSRKVTGSGTFTVDGSTQAILKDVTIEENRDKKLTTISFYSSGKDIVGIAIGTATLQDGTYNMSNTSFTESNINANAVGLTAYISSKAGWYFSLKDENVKVVVLGKKITVGTTQMTNANGKITTSAIITLD